MDLGKEPNPWRLDQGLRKRGLAKILAVSVPTRTRWEEGLVQPHELLAKKASFYS